MNRELFFCTGSARRAKQLRAVSLWLMVLLGLGITVRGKHVGGAGSQTSEAVRLRPAMLIWNVGIGDPEGPDQLIEVVTQATLGARKTWRVIHFPQDPTSDETNSYDLYDLDSESMAPLRSVYNNQGSHLELLFGDKEVTVRHTSLKGSESEKVPVTEPVKPEGPGGAAFVASLPLHPGYHLQYKMVDRWDGRGQGRLKTVDLSVLKRDVERTAIGKKSVYIVRVKPTDGSFEITQRVLAAAPHFPVKIEYIRGGLHLVSEIVSLAIGA
jgi:hypothetical protein